MSHCISTVLNGKEYFITAGSSFKTLNAVAESGFDIYGVFNAYESYSGMSGSGNAYEINIATATHAYKHAVAWVKALEQSFPDAYKENLNELRESQTSFLTCLRAHPFPKKEIDSLIKEKIEDQSHLHEVKVKRAFYLFYSILPFTFALYKYTLKDKKATIYFM